jgi:hypothetical protein
VTRTTFSSSRSLVSRIHFFESCKPQAICQSRNLSSGQSSLDKCKSRHEDHFTTASNCRDFWGGLLAGAFDLTQAFIGFGLLGAVPYRILQHIAGGIFGTRSYQMGWVSAAIGLVCHFIIAFTAATLYYLASRKLHMLLEHPVICGLLYGEGVFVFMYFAVLPLSALGPAQFNIATYITGPVGHPLLVGLPIALSVRHFAGRSYIEQGGPYEDNNDNHRNVPLRG